jgi:tetratricopeptide (TPR) repeat protein
MLANEQHAELDALRQTAYEDWKHGKLSEAADCYQKVLSASDSAQTPVEQRAQDLHSMGVLDSQLGRYAEAKKQYERELKLLHGSDHHVTVGLAYASLAGVQQLEGSFSEAEVSYKNAVRILSDFAGPVDQRTATALNGLAWLYTLWGRTQEADRFLKKARDVAEKALPPNDPALIRFLDTEASLLTMTGKYTEAERLWKRALEIGKEAYPGDEGKYGEVLLHLGQSYAVVGDDQPAKNMLQRFLATDNETAGPDGAVRAVATAELARIFTDQHKYTDAEPLFLQSIHILEGQPGQVPLSDALVHSYFGDYYMERSRWKDAEAQYRTALGLRSAMLGDNAPDVAASMFALSKALRKLHRKQEAKQYLARASAIMAFQKNPLYTGDTIDVRAFRGK